MVDRFEKFCALIGLELEPFQREIVREVFSDRRETLVLLPRGNGKSTLLAALSLFHLFAHPKPAAYVAAASRDQASVLFDLARGFAMAHPDIAREVEVTRREIRTANGFLKVISSDAPKQHGLIPSFVVVDELHAHQTDDLFLALTTALVKVPGAKLVTITTAGTGTETPLGRLYTRACGLASVERSGAFQRAVGPTMGMLEWSLPEDRPLEAAKECNPASWITEQALADQREAVHEIAFARYHANRWVATEAPWITADVWDTCAGEPAIPEGAQGVAVSVDASLRHDSTAVVTVWRDSEGTYHAHFKVWTPSRGHEIDLSVVSAYVREECARYPGATVVFDKQFFIGEAQRLEAEGLPVVEMPQDNARMVPATMNLHQAVTHRRLRHGGHAIARQHALAASVRETERGIRIKKSASRERIDSTIALAMAIEFLSRQPEPRRSVYESRGLVSA